MNVSRLRGFSTIELLIAFAILFIVLPPLMLLAFGGQTGALDVTLTNGGVHRLATQIRDAVASTTANWNVTPQPWATSFYSATNTVTSISPCLKQIAASTSWNSAPSRGQYATATTYIPNITIAKASGGGCDPFPPSTAWDNPEDPNWDVTPSELSGHGTGVAAASISGTEYAFVTTEQSGNPSPSDLWVIDVSDPSDPNPVDDLNTGNGLNGIAIGGSYAYVIQNDTTKQFMVIDVSNPTSLDASDIVASTSLPDTTTGVPRSVFYYDNKVYVGTQYQPCPGSCTSTQNNEFHVYDVSNPANPQHVGRLNINHNINDIFVSGTNAYLATSDDSGELMMVDITNPGTMIHPDVSGKKFNPSGNFDGLSVYVLGTDAYLGRDRATGTSFDFYLVDTSNPIAMIGKKTKRLGLANNTGLVDIIVRSQFAFLVTSDSNQTFQVWNVVASSTGFVPVNSLCPNVLNLAKSRAISSYGDVVMVINDNQAALNVLRDEPDVCNAP